MSDDSIIDLIKQHQSQGGASKPQDQPQETPAPVASGGAGKLKQVESMSNNLPVDKNIQETLDFLLKNVQDKLVWVDVELPSRGILYESNATTVKVRPFTYKDERALKSIQGASNPEALLENLLRNCIDGMRVEELTPIDRLYLLFKIRGISYGDEYGISHSCQGCGSENNLNLKISTLNTVDLTEEDMKFILPDSLQEVEVRYPRIQDENLYSTAEKLMDNMYRFVKSVGGVQDSLIIEQFVRGTTVRDIDTLRNRIFAPKYGMETEFFYNCGECGKRQQVDINLNSNFFSAS